MLDFQSPLPDPTVGPYKLASCTCSPAGPVSPGPFLDVGRQSGLRILVSPQCVRPFYRGASTSPSGPEPAPYPDPPPPSVVLVTASAARTAARTTRTDAAQAHCGRLPLTRNEGAAGTSRRPPHRKLMLQPRAGLLRNYASRRRRLISSPPATRSTIDAGSGMADEVNDAVHVDKSPTWASLAKLNAKRSWPNAWAGCAGS